VSDFVGTDFEKRVRYAGDVLLDNFDIEIDVNGAFIRKSEFVSFISDIVMHVRISIGGPG